jgi:hypothetical protein
MHPLLHPLLQQKPEVVVVVEVVLVSIAEGAERRAVEISGSFKLQK